jgi:hypothetical protein
MVPARFYRDTPAGGLLCFREDGLVFTPRSKAVHADRTFIPYSQIWLIFRRNSLKILPSGISIFTKDGVEYKFKVRKREAVVKFITSITS